MERNVAVSELIVGMAKAAHTMAIEKEWWKRGADGKVDFSSRNFKQLIILGTSELSEALEICREKDASLTEICYQDSGKPEGFPIELADFVIRLGDTLAASGNIDSVHIDDKTSLAKHFDETDVFSMLYDLNVYCFAKPNVFDQLARAIVASFIVADRCDFDLWQAIDIKRAYNATREVRHGGKVA